MRNLRLSYVGFASAIALGANGCASTPPPAKLVEVRPVHTAAPSPESAASNIYREAVSAIGRRDYARALDLLQTARDRAPHDARVLNAFGVVYDKLGRFDLSGRYYAQAQAADPTSTIVAENRAYSDVLQGTAPPTALASQTAIAPSALPAQPTAPRAAILAAVTPSASGPSGPAHVAVVSAIPAPPPVHAPIVVASAQMPAKPGPQETPRAQAAPVRLTALPVRTIVAAKPPELKRLPSTVGLSIRATPSIAMQPAAAPLQIASIAAAPKPLTRPPLPQAASTQQPPPAVAPASVLKVSLAPAKPLAVARPPAPPEAVAPALTPVALRTASPALVIPAQSTRAALTVRPMQMADATTLHRVSLPTFQPVAVPPSSASPDRPKPAPSPTVDAHAAHSLPPPAPAVVAAVAKAPATPAAVDRPTATPASRSNPPAPVHKVAVAIQRPATPAAPLKTERPLRAAITPPSLVMAHAAPVASSHAPARPGAAFIGRALVIVDASGNARNANAMRLQLARRGWTVTGARPQTSAIRSQTTIRYAPAHAVVARALANSLRIPVRFERCSKSCQGVSLILGKDSRTASRNFRTGSGFRRLSQ